MPITWFLVARETQGTRAYMRSLCGPSDEPARWSPYEAEAIHYPTADGAGRAAAELPRAGVTVCHCEFCERGAK